MRYHKNNQQQKTKKSKPSSNVLNQKTPQKLSKKEVIEFFYSLHENGTIDRKMLEDHILQRSDKKEIHALFYAIKGLVEQRLGISTAEASIKKSRDLLAPFFDTVVDNFNVACTYSLLASYESGSGKRSLCKFYIGAARCYVDGKKDEELNQNELAFKKGLFMMDIFLSNNEFCLSMMVKDFPKIFEYFTSEKLPPEIAKALQQPITPENYHEHLRLFEVVGTFIRKHMVCKDKDEESDETKARATELFKSIISNGVKISLLTKAGYGDCPTVEEAALKITLLTEQDLFSYFSVVVLTYIAMAARVHLRIVNKIEQGLRQNLLTGVTLDNAIVPIDYYQILEKDYTALKSMGKKYKRVEVDYNSIITEIEEILHKRQENTLKTTPTNNSSCLESPTTNCDSDNFDPFLSNEDMLQMFLQGASFQF